MTATASAAAPSALTVAAPFVLALLMLAISPLLTAQVKRTFHGQLAQDAITFNATEAAVPPHLAPNQIDDYLDYVADAVQIFPLTILPIAGAIFTFSSAVTRNVAVFILIICVIGAIGLNAWVLKTDAPTYVSRTRHGYSIITGVGATIDVICLVLVIVGS